MSLKVKTISSPLHLVMRKNYCCCHCWTHLRKMMRMMKMILSHWMMMKMMMMNYCWRSPWLYLIVWRTSGLFWTVSLLRRMKALLSCLMAFHFYCFLLRILETQIKHQNNLNSKAILKILLAYWGIKTTLQNSSLKNLLCTQKNKNEIFQYQN